MISNRLSRPQERSESSPTEENALAQFFRAEYATLVRLARSKLRCLRPSDGLEPCSLVHECYLRMLVRVNALRGDRVAHLAYASRTMQSIIIDQARYKASARRGGMCELSAIDVDSMCDDDDFSATESHADIDVRRALDRLVVLDPRAARAAVLHFVADAPLAEIATELGVVVRTVTRDCMRAREALRESLLPVAA